MLTEVVGDVIHAALQLTESQRALVVDALLASLQGPEKDAYEEEWLEEIDRRSDAFDKDPSSALTWEQVKERAWRRAGRA